MIAEQPDPITRDQAAALVSCGLAGHLDVGLGNQCGQAGGAEGEIAFVEVLQYPAAVDMQWVLGIRLVGGFTERTAGADWLLASSKWNPSVYGNGVSVPSAATGHCKESYPSRRS